MNPLKQALSMSLSHLLMQGTKLSFSTGYPTFTPPAVSRTNAGFKRNRRAELKRRAVRIRKCRH